MIFCVAVAIVKSQAILLDIFAIIVANIIVGFPLAYKYKVYLNLVILYTLAFHLFKV